MTFINIFNDSRRVVSIPILHMRKASHKRSSNITKGNKGSQDHHQKKKKKKKDCVKISPRQVLCQAVHGCWKCWGLTLFDLAGGARKLETDLNFYSR